MKFSPLLDTFFPIYTFIYDDLQVQDQKEIENMNEIILDSLPPASPGPVPGQQQQQASNHYQIYNQDLANLKSKYVNSIIRMKDSNSIIYNPDVIILFFLYCCYCIIDLIFWSFVIVVVGQLLYEL